MQNTFPDWLFNVLLLGGIVGTLLLGVHTLAAPVLGAMTLLIAAALVLIVSAFWPKW